jgi:hypothetical protein
MKCNKHDKMVVLHAFSSGDCIVCGKEITTEHIPCNKVCPDCSEEHGLCEICGEKIMNEKKLKLEVLDPTGAIVVTHHFFYKAGHGNRLRLTITDNQYIMDKDGKLVILTQEEIDREAKHKEQSKLQYFNPKTGKMQGLFDKPE